jgi:hypothetical protein
MQMAGAQQDNSKVSTDAAPAENGHDPASNPGEDEWDEERLEKAMNTLKEIHIQVGMPWSIAMGLLLICLIATWVTDHNPKAHRTSDNQAAVTYVLQICFKSSAYSSGVSIASK